jgi:hypothetical protein
MMVKPLFIVLLVCISSAQKPDIEWEKTYGGSQNDKGNAVLNTSDGGYAIVGYTESFGIGEKDVFLIKTDSNGNKLWERTFGGERDDEGNSILQLSDGGYIIAGNTHSLASDGAHTFT